MTPTAFTASTPVCLTAYSFRGTSLSTARAPSIAPLPARCRRLRVRMGSVQVIEKKSAIVDSVKERLSESEMIFSVPLPGLTVSNVAKFKESLPEGTSTMTVKNTLMRRAIADSGWEVAGPILKESSIWVFVKEDIKGSVEAYKKFAKECDRDAISGGVLENTLYDTEGIMAIGALPSRIELIAQIAGLIKAVPTKAAVAIKMVPTKLARAVKLACAEEDGGEASTE